MDAAHEGGIMVGEYAGPVGIWFNFASDTTPHADY